jgi:NAD-dependent deacetylase
MAIGTPGIVTPASAFVEEARKLGAESWLVNLDPAQNEAYFDRVLLGERGAILPQLVAEKRAQFMAT